MHSRTVLISGAGIAGPTVAYWLQKHGFSPTIVERALAPRTGGYIIDFWGVGFDVAERMGIVPALRKRGYFNDRAVFVRSDGRERSSFGGSVLRQALGERFLSIPRGDLAQILYEKVDEKVELIFGNEISTVTQFKDRVLVCFKSGMLREFDFVIGADGLHSAVRAKAFPGDMAAERYLGRYAAVFVTKGYSKRDEGTYLSYAVPGRQISRFSLRNDETGIMFVFSSKDRDPSFAKTFQSQKEKLLAVFSDARWVEWPEIRDHLERSDNLYFDAVSQIELPRWSSGSFVLLGDAAYCPSLLAGEGAAFAMAGAYILAGQLARAQNVTQAFTGYERLLRPFIVRKQKAARSFASSFSPATSFGLTVRDVVLHLAANPIIANLLIQGMIADRFALPSYEI